MVSSRRLNSMGTRRSAKRSTLPAAAGYFSVCVSQFPAPGEYMPEQPDLDPHAILAALGITGAAEATPVSGGSDTAIWRVAHGRQIYALRLFRAEQAATCQREIAAMRAAQAGGLPVP